MPKKPMDYSRTIMYKLVCKDLLVTDIYLGHTTDFVKRKCYHKGSCNNEKCKDYKYKIYQTIRANGNWDNWEMIEIEKYECKDGNEARARERYWYEYFSATLNTQVPNRTEKEYKKTEKYKEKKRIDSKKYRLTNKEKTTEQFTCECGGYYVLYGKNRHLTSKKHINFNNSHINHFQPTDPSHIVETELEVGSP